ncbi:MAG: TonB-dependent receptor, partial [Flavobacteriales bacterium]|nr:TonB-dependent receptor [Flavobacteriales bacterium]
MHKLAYRIFFLMIGSSASAQQQDSILFYSEGNISERSFDVEEILVRPSCACIGECSCSNTSESNYSENRFACTDAILAKNGRVSMIKRGNYAFEPVVNGMASDRLNMTIDGMKIFGACTDKMDPVTSYVEPNNMKSLSVQHGATGSKFGSNIGGSINMETNGAIINPKKRLSGEVGAGFQSAALGFNGLFSLNYSQKRWAIMINGVYRKFQNYRSGGGTTIKYSQFEKWNGSVSAKYMPTSKDVLRFDFIMDEAYNIGYPALPMDVLYAKAKIYGLTYQHYPTAKWFKKFETKVYANTISHSMDDTKRPNAIMHMDMPGETRTFGGYLDGRFKAEKHEMTIRVDGFHSNARAEMTMYPENEVPMFMLTWPDVDKLDLGIYLQDDMVFNKKRKLSLNARFEYLSTTVMDELGVQQASVFNQDISRSDHRLLKNASLSYMDVFSKGFTAWITAGYTERGPTTTEQYAFYIFNALDGFDYVGKKDIQNEKAIQGDIGLQFEQEKFALRATGFYYYMLDYILAQTDTTLDAMTMDANGVKFSANISSAQMAGGNLYLSYKPIRSLYLNTVCNFTYGSTGDGQPLPLIPPFSNTTSVKWSYKQGFVQLECESAANQQRFNSEFGEAATEAYAILNLRASYFFTFSKKRLTINGGIENLLDSNYHTH